MFSSLNVCFFVKFYIFPPKWEPLESTFITASLFLFLDNFTSCGDTFVNMFHKWRQSIILELYIITVMKQKFRRGNGVTCEEFQHKFPTQHKSRLNSFTIQWIFQFNPCVFCYWGALKPKILMCPKYTQKKTIINYVFVALLFLLSIEFLNTTTEKNKQLINI